MRAKSQALWKNWRTKTAGVSLFTSGRKCMHREMTRILLMPTLIRKCVVTCPVAFLWEEINNSWLEVKLAASAINRSLSSIDSKKPSLYSCHHNTPYFHNTLVCSSMQARCHAQPLSLLPFLLQILAKTNTSLRFRHSASTRDL